MEEDGLIADGAEVDGPENGEDEQGIACDVCSSSAPGAGNPVVREHDASRHFFHNLYVHRCTHELALSRSFTPVFFSCPFLPSANTGRGC
jgi:hypothetical protein